MAGVAVLHNPHARRNRKRPHISDALKTCVGDDGFVWETQTPDELPAFARECLNNEIDVLCVNGGDGTAHLTLTAFAHVYADRPLPTVVSLRGGTMNTFPSSFKHKGSTERILARTMELFRRHEPFETLPHQTLRVNNKYGFIFGNGLVSTLIEKYIGSGKDGNATAWPLIVRAIGSSIVGGKLAKELFAPMPCAITVDGTPLPFPAITAQLISVQATVGMGMRIPYRAYEKLGAFHYIGTDMRPLKIATQIPKWFMAMGMNQPEHLVDAVASEVVCDTGEPRPYIMDGEIYTDDARLTITLGPTIKVVRMRGRFNRLPIANPYGN